MLWMLMALACGGGSTCANTNFDETDGGCTLAYEGCTDGDPPAKLLAHVFPSLSKSKKGKGNPQPMDAHICLVGDVAWVGIKRPWVACPDPPADGDTNAPPEPTKS